MSLLTAKEKRKLKTGSYFLDEVSAISYWIQLTNLDLVRDKQKVIYNMIDTCLDPIFANYKYMKRIFKVANVDRHNYSIAGLEFIMSEIMDHYYHILIKRVGVRRTKRGIAEDLYSYHDLKTHPSLVYIPNKPINLDDFLNIVGSFENSMLPSVRF